MTLEEAKIALEHEQHCEFYSTGRGWVAWLDEGWHGVDLQEVDIAREFVKAYSRPFTIEVRGRADVEKCLRLAGA